MDPAATVPDEPTIADMVAAAESGDSISYYIFSYHEDAVGAAWRGGGFGSAPLTRGDVTIR